MRRSLMLPLVLGSFAFVGPASGETGLPEAPPEPVVREAVRPNVLLIAVDTLRADHLSGMGYRRPTSPKIDRILAEGVRFDDARTVEPLTNPAMCSILTSRMPHFHGASRNGLRIREGLTSLPKTLSAAGYRTAAFVGNWTLRDKISGLGEHFDEYHEVFSKKRWFGMFAREATADDLVDDTVDWIRDHAAARPGTPFFGWVHFVEPHEPYVDHTEFHERLGLAGRENLHARDRYDTEIAFVDRAIGQLLERIEPLSPARNTVVVFVSDHGESLGEHNYWGHGRNLHEPNLRIPMAFRWPAELKSGAVAGPSSNLDLAPTLLGLLGVDAPLDFQGFDWSPVLRGDAPEPTGRKTFHQAHKGAVVGRSKSALARRSGLLSLAIVTGTQKEIFRVDRQKHVVYDLASDPGERRPLSPADTSEKAPIMGWMRTVFDGLAASDEVPVQPLDEESVSALKSLGYVD